MTENTFYYNKNINDGLPFIPETNTILDVNTKPLPKYIKFNIASLDVPLIISSLNMYDVNTQPLPKTVFTQNSNKTEYPKIIELSVLLDVNTKPLPKTLLIINNNKTEFPIIMNLIIDHKPLEETLPKLLFNRHINVSISFTDNKYDSFKVPIVCDDTPNFSDKYTGSFENTNINEIVIPKSVEIIGKKAFNNCENLNEVEISESCYYEENSFPDNTIIKYLK